MPGRGEVGGGRPQATAGRGLLVGVGRRTVEPGGEHDMGGVQVGVQPGGAFAQQARIPVAGVEQVVQQLPPYALLGLGRRAAGEQQERGDHRRALQGALVDGVEAGVPAQDQRAQEFAAGGHRGDPVAAVPYGVSLGTGHLQRVRGCRAGLGELDGAVEDFGDGGGHVVHPAAPQDEFGEPVVDVGGALDDGAAVPDDLVGVLQAGQGRAGLGEQMGGVDRRRGERGEGAEQGDLRAFEDPFPAVGGEEDADDVRPEHEGDAEDGDQALVTDAGVDGEGVLEAGVLEVVVRDVRPGRLGDQSAESLAHAEAQLLEAGRDGALRDPHVGVTARRVVQGEVGDVRAEQGTGALHDGLQDGVQIAQAREVVGGLEERGQLGLAAPASLQLGPDAQGEQLGLFQRGDRLGRSVLGAGEQDRLLVRLRGGVAGQQLEVGSLGAAAGCRLNVIARHGHRIPHRPAGPSGLWKTPRPGAAGHLQWAVQPPSSTSEVPVTKDACGLHR